MATTSRVPLVLNSSKKATQGCPCGFLGDPKRECRCTSSAVDRYRRKLSGPLRDRFDLAIDVQAVAWSELRGDTQGEQTAPVRARVMAARMRQAERQGVLNAQLDGRSLRNTCRIADTGDLLLGKAVTRLGLSARAVTRVLRVARTIADLAEAPNIADDHLTEALQFRLPA